MLACLLGYLRCVNLADQIQSMAHGSEPKVFQLQVKAPASVSLSIHGRKAIKMKDPISKVLVVDDDLSIRRAIALALEPLCHRVWAADSGEEALQVLDREEVTLMLLDLMLPGIDGIETLDRVKQSHPRVQVIVITAFATVDRTVEAMRLGAVDLIQKPFSADEIRRVANRAIRRRHLSTGVECLSYELRLEQARQSIGRKQLEEALQTLRGAIGLDPSRPHAFNLMGECLEAGGRVSEAQKNYRAALALDPTYRAAQQNLHRTVSGWSENLLRPSQVTPTRFE